MLSERSRKIWKSKSSSIIFYWVQERWIHHFRETEFLTQFSHFLLKSKIHSRAWFFIFICKFASSYWVGNLIKKEKSKKNSFISYSGIHDMRNEKGWRKFLRFLIIPIGFSFFLRGENDETQRMSRIELGSAERSWIGLLWVTRKRRIFFFIYPLH